MDELRNDTELQQTIKTALKNSPLRKFADTEIRYGRRLGWYAFIRALKPKIVLETGVDKGLGAMVICAAILRNEQEGFKGQYFGTDINPNAGYLLRGKYKEVASILYGDSIKSLNEFNGEIDLFINDSDHSAKYENQEYTTIYPKLSARAIILGDNSHATSKLSDFSESVDRKFLFFREEPLNHWYPGSGIGISYIDKDSTK
jgi:predicted O-methyltransferase YrrM